MLQSLILHTSFFLVVKRLLQTFKTLHAQNLLDNHELRNINLANIYLFKIKNRNTGKRNIQMVKNNFYKVVVQKWFLNGVIKNRCQLCVDLVVNWMTFHYE